MQPGKIIYQGILKNKQMITIRYQKLSDISKLAEYINKLSQEKTFISFQGEKISLKEEEKYVKENIKRIKLNKLIVLTALVNNQIIGTVDISLNDKIFNHVGTFGITVSKNYRGLGIGRLLMKLVIEEATKNLKDLRIITLECFANNKIAISLYKKMGFIEFGKLPKGLKRKGKFSDQLLMYLKVK